MMASTNGHSLRYHLSVAFSLVEGKACCGTRGQQWSFPVARLFSIHTNFVLVDFGYSPTGVFGNATMRGAYKREVYRYSKFWRIEEN